MLWGSPLADSLWHMVLPVAMLAFFNTATLTLLMRSNLVDVLRNDFIMAARASGLPERRVVFGHALRNAFIPVLTYLGILFGLMLGTAPGDRDGLHLAGRRLPLHLGDPAARLSGHHGSQHDHHRHARRGDAPDRHRLCPDRSADQAGIGRWTRPPQRVTTAPIPPEAGPTPRARPACGARAGTASGATRTGMLGLGLVGLVVLVALACPLLAPFDPNDQSAMMNFGSRAAPSLKHPLGTDRMGYDVLSRVVYGAPTALAVGLGAMLVASVIGMIIGGVERLSRRHGRRGA